MISAFKPSTGTHNPTEKRVARIGRLYLEGYTPGQIADALGVGRSTVMHYLAKLNEEWRRDDKNDYATKLAEEIAGLKHSQAKAARAYRRSQRPAQVAKRTFEVAAAPAADPEAEFDPFADAPQREMVLVTEVIEERGQCGDPRFLQIEINCRVERLKLMGAYKDPERSDVVTFAQMGQFTATLLRAIEAECRDRDLAERLKARTLGMLPATPVAGVSEEAAARDVADSAPPANRIPEA